MSRTEVDVRLIDGDAELAALAEIEAWSFGVSSTECQAWLTRAGLDNVRVGIAAGKLAGGYLSVPMGQWFGGRSVPMTGIAGVGVAAAARGSGVARSMMAFAIRELRAQQVPLSALYPATMPLYRSAGYELAGCRFQVKLAPGRIGIQERELPVREITDADATAIEAAYRAHAARQNGYLDRGDYVWQRIRAPRNEPARGWLVEVDGKVEGYVYVRQKSAGLSYELTLTDLSAVTRRAARRLLSFLSDHRSLAENVSFFASPADPFVTDLPERGAEVRLNHHWMLRIIDPAAALRARGYSPGQSAELDLALRDELLGEEQRLRLSVAGGRAEVREGGSGALSLDIRGLAQLYSGFATPHDVVRAGLAEADDETLAVAQGIFSLPAPTMPDMF
ncbi:MAG: GNAT family N-acetyltransferase [Myxococcales bacterium]|nr:GNAT family N-acetyltransferase [Myxococcales bacterium]